MIVINGEKNVMNCPPTPNLRLHYNGLAQRRLNVYDIVFCINTLVCLSCCNIVLLCYAIIILMLILINDVCFYYFSARWEVEASMMMIGQCANKVSVCFVKRSPRSCAGLIFCTDQLLYSLSLFYFSRGVANAHAKHRNGVPEGLPTPMQST